MNFLKLASIVTVIALSQQSNASPITVDIDLASWTNNPSAEYGNNMSVALTIDNGGSSLINQTWAATDIFSITAFINGTNVYEWTSSTSTFNSSAGTELLRSNGDGVVSLLIGSADTTESNYINTGNALGRIQFYNAPSVGSYEYLAYLDVYSFTGGARSAISGSFNNATVVPVPAAVWLFGSGLIGLIGLAKRKKA